METVEALKPSKRWNPAKPLENHAAVIFDLRNAARKVELDAFLAPEASRPSAEQVYFPPEETEEDKKPMRLGDFPEELANIQDVYDNGNKRLYHLCVKYIEVDSDATTRMIDRDFGETQDGVAMYRWMNAAGSDYTPARQRRLVKLVHDFKMPNSATTADAIKAAIDGHYDNWLRIERNAKSGGENAAECIEQVVCAFGEDHPAKPYLAQMETCLHINGTSHASFAEFSESLYTYLDKRLKRPAHSAAAYGARDARASPGRDPRGGGRDQRSGVGGDQRPPRRRGTCKQWCDMSDCHAQTIENCWLFGKKAEPWKGQMVDGKPLRPSIRYRF